VSFITSKYVTLHPRSMTYKWQLVEKGGADSKDWRGVPRKDVFTHLLMHRVSWSM